MADRDSSSARYRLALGLLVALGACQPAPRAPAPAAPVTAAPAPTGPVLTLDTAHSELRILAYRAGALAKFGHNHVILSHDLSGNVHLSGRGTYAGGTFDIELPVATLVIDDPAARRAEGAEFTTTPSATDIEGTRHNMLGSALLDAEHFPTLRVHGTTSGTTRELVAQVTFEVRGHASTVEVPVTVTPGPGTLTVRGGFGIAQSALGLTPFSVALGALSVRDQLEVRFDLVARTSS